MRMRNFCISCFLLLISIGTANAQLNARSSKVDAAFQKQQDSIIARLNRINIKGVPAGMYLRSFKYEKILEVWVREKNSSAYKLYKTYDVCTQSGTIGPKRVEGDYQVPEGFYYINEFKQNSAYYLSLGINYPNASDRILSDPARPGSAIYVHGSCVSVGCLPITDKNIEELFVLGKMVSDQNEQEFIPVHIFPIRYNNKKSAEFLQQITKGNQNLALFNANIKQVYDYFETKKSLPLILVNNKGEYLLN